MASSSPNQTTLLEYIPPNVDTDGSPVILIQSDDIESGSTMWHTSAVGFVVGLKPGFISMKKFIEARWKEYGQVEVYRMEYGWFVFKFPSIKARDRAIEREQPWTFSELPLILKPWTPTVEMTEKKQEVIPIWIRIPNPPLWVYNSNMLSRIASFVGKPVCCDRLTGSPERLSYARLFVEVEAGAKLPCEVPLKIEGREMVMQEVVYEWVCVRCKLCDEIGHLTRNCHLKKPEVVQNVPT